MDEAPVLVDIRDGYRIITLNRPERINAFNEAMHRALRDAIEAAAADPACRALLLTGAGRGFCSGQDLNDRLVQPGELAQKTNTLEEHYNPLIRRLHALPIPGGRGRARSRGRRRRKPRAWLRHRAGGALGALHPGLRQDRPDPRCGRDLGAAAAGRAWRGRAAWRSPASR